MPISDQPETEPGSQSGDYNTPRLVPTSNSGLYVNNRSVAGQFDAYPVG